LQTLAPETGIAGFAASIFQVLPKGGIGCLKIRALPL
jgi:hypothetical protein